MDVLLIHNADDGKVSFVGGGLERIDKFNASRALRREVIEEVDGARPSLHKARNALLLCSGTTQTSRVNYRARRVFVFAIPHRGLHKIRPANEEHINFMVLPLQTAIEYIRSHELTPVESRDLYIRALEKLAKLKRT